MSPLLGLGEWFASAFLDALIDKLSSHALHLFGLQSGPRLQDDLRRLRNSLLKVRAVVLAAEKRQPKDENLTQLMRLLKDAAYDADDLLDEFEYRVQQKKVEGRREASGFLTSALSFANHLFDCDHGDAVGIVREIQERIDSVTAEMKDLIEVLGDGGGKQREIWVSRETGSLLTEPEVFGRDGERNRVVELLLKSDEASGSGDKKVAVVPIIGIGGVGKTTLAQLVYHDSKVEEYFQLRMWVCVSDPFDVKRITKEIVESVPGEKHFDITNLNRLQLILKEKLMSQRFLLVLDDVWNEDRTKWESLCAPLRFGPQGSKVLVTTRSQKVAETMGASDPIFLNGLLDDVYWSFFKKCAFGSQEIEKYPKLEAIGKKIADRLKGSPLAAKMLGSLLNTDLDEQHWRSVLHSEIWELQQGENDILPVLELSYEYLPACLKQCFAYCSLLPKDHQFDKDRLVQIWMAQGFIVCQGNMRLEDVGNRYFNDLLCRSFFQHYSHNTYVMHDLLHDLAMSVSVDECFKLEDGKSQDIPTSIRHLSICTSHLDLSKLMDFCKCRKLRTLVFVGNHRTNLNHALDGLLRELTGIRVLGLSCCEITELPDSIGNLKHLRYLNISYTDIQRLPNSICSLYNLQALKVKRSTNDSPLQSFPTDITNLINLRHLDADRNKVAQIPEIGRLTALQNLKLFKVVKQCRHQIGELKEMNELRRKLCITNLENVRNKEEACQAKLHNKKYLEGLCLEWTSDRHLDLGKDVSDADVLEGLQPHPDLKMLNIRSYGGFKYPSWLHSLLLLNLETVYLVNCRRLEQLPALGQLPFLKVLQIQSMHSVRRIGEEFYGITELKVFPLLETIGFKDMPVWEEWSGAEGSQLFPRLRDLCIKNCPKLKGLPSLGSVSLSSMYIEECPNLTSLEEWLFANSLPTVKKISIIDCGNLSSLPVERFKHFICLEHLEIRDCPKLTSALPGKELNHLLPSSLRVLILHLCGDLDMSLPGCLQNLTSLSTLEMIGCPHITSLPIEVLRHLTALGHLTIQDCAELRSLGALQCLTSLKWLKILKCPLLTTSLSLEDDEHREGISLLSYLCIDGTLLHRLQLLRARFISLKVLDIYDSLHLTLFADGEEQEWFQNLRSLRSLSFVDCANLQSLPSGLSTVSTLEELHIINCPELQSLPENGLPVSLRELKCQKCHPKLKARCQRGNGIDWPKIAYIRHICIDGYCLFR